MDTRTLIERLRDSNWVKDWFDQAGYEAAARIEKLESALGEISGVGFDAPMTWCGTDAEWERKRANIMQRIANDAIKQ